MTAGPLDRVRSDPRVVALDAEGALEFAKREAPGLLLLPGVVARAEVPDVAVVLGELAVRFPGLRLAVADGDEATLKARFGLPGFPALLFVRDGEVKTALARMHSWSTYESAARALGGAS